MSRVESIVGRFRQIDGHVRLPDAPDEATLLLTTLFQLALSQTRLMALLVGSSVILDTHIRTEIEKGLRDAAELADRLLAIKRH